MHGIMNYVKEGSTNEIRLLQPFTVVDVVVRP